MRSAVVQYRRDIAALKRTVAAQEKEIAFLKSQERKRIASKPTAPEAALDGDVRFSARSARAQRKRLGLSAEDLGKGQRADDLQLGTRGVATEDTQFAKLVEIRRTGKREAARWLDVLGE